MKVSPKRFVRIQKFCIGLSAKDIISLLQKSGNLPKEHEAIPDNAEVTVANDKIELDIRKFKDECPIYIKWEKPVPYRKK